MNKKDIIFKMIGDKAKHFKYPLAGFYGEIERTFYIRSEDKKMPAAHIHINLGPFADSRTLSIRCSARGDVGHYLKTHNLLTYAKYDIGDPTSIEDLNRDLNKIIFNIIKATELCRIGWHKQVNGEKWTFKGAE